MEIEKKFLVRTLPPHLAQYKHHHILQRYVSYFPTIRIRQQDQCYILTVKGKGDLVREEFELPIEKAEFEALWKKTEGISVEKVRYLIPLQPPLVAELDIYTQFLDGLATVEVEFSSVEEADQFIPPDWFGKEVTYDHRFSNSYLSTLNDRTQLQSFMNEQKGVLNHESIENE